MSKEFYEVVYCNGLATGYLALVEVDFAASAGLAYTPPERGDFRRIVSARQLQLLQDSPGVIETFQTSAGTVRLPGSTLDINTDDAKRGRLYWFKNSGTDSITIQDYLGSNLWVVRQDAIVLVVGNDNNNWDFYFTAKNIAFDPTISDMESFNVQDAIDEIFTSASVSASPGFTWGRSGNLPNNTYLLCDTVPSNIASRVATINGYIAKIFVTQRNSTAFTFAVETRVGAVFTTIYTGVVPATRKVILVPTPQVNVAIGDEICIRISNTGNPQDVDLGILLKGSIV